MTKNSNVKKKEKKKHPGWWIIPLIIFIFLIPIALIICYPYHASHKLFLKYLSVIASWPIAILILASIIVILFREPISKKILDLLKISKEGAEFGQRSPELETTPTIEPSSDPTRAEIIRTKKHERVIGQIYRSQLEMLELLKAHREEGNPKIKSTAIEKRFYDGIYLEAGGPKFWIYSFYLSYLKQENLIKETMSEEGNPLIEITENGVDFLSYFQSEGFSITNLKPW